MTSLIESVASSFGPDIVKSLGSVLGTDPSAITRALGAASPLLLSGMTKMASTPAGAESLLKLLPHDSGFLGNLASAVGNVFGGAQGGAAALLPALFGQGTSAIAGNLSRTLGFNVAPLINLLAPAMLGAVAKLVKERNLDAAGLGATLKEEADAFRNAPEHRETATLVHDALTSGEAAQVVITRFGADWAAAVSGPAAALAAVATADLSGPMGSIAEARAANDALEKAARHAAPGSLLATAFGAGLTTEMLTEVRRIAPTRDGLIEQIRKAATAVATHAPDEVQAYRDTLQAVAQASAEATKDGGFLGIGGKLVSKDEQVALDAIRSALG